MKSKLSFHIKVTGPLVALIAASISTISADVVVTYNNGNPGYGGLTIPQASSTDYLQGKPPIYTDGTLYNYGPDIAVSQPFSALTDGLVQANNNDVSKSVFFAQSGAGVDVTNGRVLFDLGTTVPISQINTYSWHITDRNAQNYTVYGANSPTDLNPAVADGAPDTMGYTLIANVSSIPTGVGNAQGISINNTVAGNIGSYRYLLFDIFPPTIGSAGTNTFFGEFDVIIGSAVPNPLAVTGITRQLNGNVVIDFTGRPITTHNVTKSLDLLVPFAPLTIPLTVETHANGFGQAVVPASEASEPREFYRIEMIPAISARTQIAALNTGQGNFFDS